MRPGARAVLVIAVVVFVIGVLAVRTVGDQDPLREAQALVDDDDGFGTATQSGVTLTKVSERLESAGERCLKSAKRGNCDALFAGAGYTRVSAVGILSCTRPGIFDARAALRAYLDRLADGDTAVDTPDLVRC